jgi:hypothetical protein
MEQLQYRKVPLAAGDRPSRLSLGRDPDEWERGAVHIGTAPNAPRLIFHVPDL